MNKLNILVLATAAILAAAWFANHQADQRFGLESSELLLPDLGAQLARIDTVVVTAAGNDTTSVRNQDGQWQVLERDGFHADIESLSQALRSLAKAKKLEAKTALASQYAQLGVQDVDLATDTTLRLQAKAGDSVVFDILIGKSGRSGHYVRLSEQSQSWLIDQRISLPRNTADYLDRDLLKLPRDQVAEVKVTPLQGPSYSIHKADADSNQFVLSPPAGEGKQTNMANVNRLAAALANLNITDVLSEPPGAVQWSQAKVTSYNGLLLHLELAKDEDASQRYLKLSAQLDPDYESRLQQPPAASSEGETPADEPSEPSVAERLEAAQQRVSQLNSLAKNRVFIAPQYTVDALMMSHAMLQKEPPTAE